MKVISLLMDYPMWLFPKFLGFWKWFSETIFVLMGNMMENRRLPTVMVLLYVSISTTIFSFEGCDSTYLFCTVLCLYLI